LPRTPGSPSGTRECHHWVLALTTGWAASSQPGCDLPPLEQARMVRQSRVGRSCTCSTIGGAV